MGNLTLKSAHRVMCGDATSEADVATLLGGAVPFIMVTDPPYGVEYDASWRDELSEANRRTGKFDNDDVKDWSGAWRLFPGDVAYCWAAARGQIESGQALLASEFKIRTQIIWRKPHFPIGRGHYTDRHEPCWYAVRDGASSAKWQGDRSASTVWDDALDKAEGGHSTQKPVAIMERPIRNHGDKDDAVYDPFLGSGTTIIAAERQDRRCYAMEIDPLYADVAVRRWEEYTGQAALLESTHETFTETRDKVNRDAADEMRE